MADLNINASWRDNLFNIEDTDNTKKAQKTKTHQAHSSSVSDTTEASQGTYQEDYVAPTDKADLERPDPNASSERTMPSKQSPEGAFEKNFNQTLANLSPRTYNKFDTLQGMPKHKVLAMVKYAKDHPNDSNVDPAIRTMLKSVSSHAQSEVEQNYNLPSDWQPPTPDEAAANEHINQTFTKNFERNLRQQLMKKGFSGDKLEKMVNEFKVAHFHPDQKKNLSHKQQSFLKNIEQKSYKMTQAETGFPKGYQVKLETGVFDADKGVDFDDNFANALETFAEENGLTNEEKAALETLHYDPEADVPGKEKLKKFLGQLNEKAMAQTQKEQHLPKGYTLKPNTPYRNAVLHGEFKFVFTNMVKSLKQPLTLEQQQMLIATGGLSAGNLPPELKAVFEELQKMTMEQIQTMFGLPRSWGPKDGKLPTIGEPEETAEPEAAEEGAQGEEAKAAGPATKTSKTKGAARADAGMGPVSGPQLKTQSAATQQVGDKKGMDVELTQKFVEHQNRVATATVQLSNEYLSPEDDFQLKDYMLAVSEALSTLRFQLYAIMADDARVRTKVSKMDQDTKLSKIKLQQQKIEDARDKGKTLPWTAIAVVLVVVAVATVAIPPLGIAASLLAQSYIFSHAGKDLLESMNMDNNIIYDALDKAADATDTASKTFLWMIDILLGGVISSLMMLMKIQPITENPLVTLGIMTEAQAQWLDLALQITVMVIEMIIMTLLAQPELVMAMIALQSMKLGTGLVVATAKFVVQVLVATVKETVMGMVKAVAEIAKTIAKAVAKVAEVALQAMRKAADAVQDTARVIRQAGEKAAREAQQLKLATQGDDAKDAQRASRLSKGDDAVDGSKGDDALKTEKTTSTSKTSSTNPNETQTQTIEAAEEEFHESVREAMKNAKKTEFEQIKEMCDQAMVYFQMYVTAKDVVSTAIQVAQGLVNFFNEKRLAELAIERSEQEGLLTSADTAVKILEKTTQAMQNTMDDQGKWVAQINKQQASYWQKMHIDYSA